MKCGFRRDCRASDRGTIRALRADTEREAEGKQPLAAKISRCSVPEPVTRNVAVRSVEFDADEATGLLLRLQHVEPEPQNGWKTTLARSR